MQRLRERLTARAAVRVVVVVAALALLSGCGVVGGLLSEKQRVGTLLTSWSQGDYMKIETVAPEGTVVIADDATRTAFLEGFPEELDTDPVRAVDLSRSFLVLGAYNKCMEQSRVWMDRRRTAVWFEDFVPREHRNTACAWSPVTIDVWLVPRTVLGDTPAAELGTSEPD